MPFSVRVIDYQKRMMLNICDEDLLDRHITQDKLGIHINKSYYGEKLVAREEAESLLKTSSIINMAGKDTVSMSLELGLGSANAVKTISGVPFLLIYNM